MDGKRSAANPFGKDKVSFRQVTKNKKLINLAFLFMRDTPSDAADNQHFNISTDLLDLQDIC